MSSTRDHGRPSPQASSSSPVAEDARQSSPAPDRKRATPLPKRQMVALAIVLLSESICSTMLLPFVGLLVAHLQNWPPEKAGFGSGVLIGVFMLGQVVSAKLWGYMSDTYGRKLPLTTGLCASAIAMLLFGLSSNIYMCGVMRFLHGFFNGNVLVAKTVIADITDKTNEAKGFALISITWGLGTLFGPAIGGFMYDPMKNPSLSWMHISERSVFSRFPALLPSLTICIYTAVALISCIFFVDETNVHRKPFNLETLKQCFRCGRASDVAVIAEESADAAAASPVTQSGKIPRRHLSYLQAAKMPAIRNVSILYMLMAASDMTYGETLPLWGIAPKEVGGLNILSSEIGVLILSYSIPSVLANVFFPNLCKLLGDYLDFWVLAGVLYTTSVLIVPMGARFGPVGYWHVMFWGIVKQIGVSWSYSLVHLLTAKAAPYGCLGAVYGISQSCASATRCVVPFIAAPVFALSISSPNHPYPFNYCLVFVLSAVPAYTSILMVQYATILNPETEEGEAVDVVVEAADPLDKSAIREVRDEASHASNPDNEAVYVSLAASFATNPRHDTYVSLVEMERTNAEAHGYNIGDQPGCVDVGEKDPPRDSETALTSPIICP